MGLEASLSMPMRSLTKACASLHFQMVSDVGKDQSKVDIDNTQFLDMVKVLPQLFKPTQQKLQMTKTSLQVRHHRPLKFPKLKQKQKHRSTLQSMMNTKLSKQRF